MLASGSDVMLWTGYILVRARLGDTLPASSTVRRFNAIVSLSCCQVAADRGSGDSWLVVGKSGAHCKNGAKISTRQRSLSGALTFCDRESFFDRVATRLYPAQHIDTQLQDSSHDTHGHPFVLAALIMSDYGGDDGYEGAGYE
jgi:hypothetical protein